MRVAMPKINRDSLNDYIFVCPSIEEQKEIVVYLNGQIKPLDQLIKIVGNSIKIFEEYRSALISAAVTGKIDVRQGVPA